MSRKLKVTSDGNGGYDINISKKTLYFSLTTVILICGMYGFAVKKFTEYDGTLQRLEEQRIIVVGEVDKMFTKEDANLRLGEINRRLDRIERKLDMIQIRNDRADYEGRFDSLKGMESEKNGLV